MDMNLNIKEAAVRMSIESKLTSHFGVSSDEATEEQIFKATALSVKEMLTAKRRVFHDKIKQTHPKRVYYLCMEFLVGRQLKNNLMNLGLADEFYRSFEQLLKEKNVLSLSIIHSEALSGYVDVH